MHPAHLLTLIPALLLPLAAAVRAQTPVVLTDERREVPLGRFMEVFEDEDKQWTIEQVSSPAFAGRFRPGRSDILNFGFTDSAYWLRFRLRNESSTAAWRLELSFANLNQVAFFAPAADGRGHRAIRTGNAHPFATRDVPHAHFIFELPLSDRGDRAADGQAFYLRVANDGPMILPLKLWSAPALEQKNLRAQLGMGLFYGIVLVMLVYNSFLFFALRDAGYFYQVLFLTCLSLCLAAYDGLLQQYLWPPDRVLPPRVIIFFMAASTVALVKFAGTFLKTRERAGGAHRIIVLLTGATGLVAALTLLLPYDRVFQAVVISLVLSYLCVFAIAGVVWRRGYRPARFFLLAFVFAVVGAVLLALTRYGALLPATWFEIGLRVAMDGFVVLFSLALADRFNLIKQENAEAQSRLLREQREALRIKDELNAELNASKIELEARNAELERFTYTVSHDLKSPVVTIKGFLGLLEKDVAAGRTERMAQDFSRIRAAADKMGRLLEELLEMSRVGRVMNPPEAVDLSQLAADAAGLVAGAIEQEGVAVEIAPDMPAVHGDRVRLLEVFQNLIDNAVKFTRGRAAPRVEIGARRQDGEVLCSVRDNGIGIDPAYHERVFGLFDQLQPDGEGTGVGLALVKRIVEVHGGRIWVESEGNGEGSTFLFTLPAKRS